MAGAGGYTENAPAAAVRANYSDSDLVSELIARLLLGNVSVSVDGSSAGSSDPVFTRSANNQHDLGNTTTTPLGAGQTWTGTWTNTEGLSNIEITAFGLNPLSLLVIDWSDDGGVTPAPNSFNPSDVLSTQQFIAGAFYGYLLATGTFPAKYYRVRATSAVVQSYMEIHTWKYDQSFMGTHVTLAQSVNPLAPALMTRTVQMGLNPDGVYANQAQLGTKTLSPATSVLGIAGVYTSDWIDCENYPNFKLLVTADVASADGGVRFNWSDSATGPARTFETRTFRTTDATSGKLLIITTRARYLQIVYTNGTVVQTRFFLNLRLNTIPVASDVSLISATAGNTGQQTVGLVSSLIAYPALAGRKSVRLKNMSTSARPLIYGFSGSLSFANGDELAVGEAIDLDIDDSVTLYVVTNSTGGAGVQASYTEIA